MPIPSASACARPVDRDRAAVELDRPRVRPHAAEQGAHERGLARAVLAEQRVHRAGLELEVRAAQRLGRAEALADPAQRDERHAR